jgi:hypothetical protein
MILSAEVEAVAELIGLREDLRRAGIGAAPARSQSTDPESTVGSSGSGKKRPNSREV